MEDVIREMMRAAIDSLVNGSHPLDPIPKRIIVVAPGDNVPHDECCEGQLSARLVSLSPQMGRTAASGLVGGGCAPQWWNATIELEVARCAYTLDEDAIAPTPEQMNSDGLQNLSDLSAMIDTVTTLEFVSGLGTWTPSGPEGGCMSSRMTFIARV